MTERPRAFQLDDELLVLEVPEPDFSQDGLTGAESAVVLLAAEGHSNRAIAERRGVSTRTIANQLASAYRKLGVQQRTELGSRKSTTDQRSGKPDES